jgi:hypothetical protein
LCSSRNCSSAPTVCGAGRFWLRRGSADCTH